MFGNFFSPAVSGSAAVCFFTTMAHRDTIRRVAVFLLVSVVHFGVSHTASADTLTLSGTGSSIATAKAMATAFLETNSDAEIRIVEPAMGSGGSIKGVIGGALDIALSARPLKARGLTETVLGHTPFVIAVAKNNDKTAGFSVRELAGVYSGATTTWADGSRLRLVLRPAADSDTSVLRSMSDGMDKAMTIAYSRRGMTYPTTDQKAADLIARTPGAVGSSTLALIVSENRPLKPLALGGVVPSVETIRGGAYPYFKSLRVVQGPKPSALAERFAAFLKSEAGRELLFHAGYWVPEE